MPMAYNDIINEIKAKLTEDKDENEKILKSEDPASFA